jgi:methylglyoxal synthase
MSDSQPVVAVVVHDEKQGEMVELALPHREQLSAARPIATDATGWRIAEAMGWRWSACSPDR